jgi:hypothetical protein
VKEDLKEAIDQIAKDVTELDYPEQYQPGEFKGSLFSRTPICMSLYSMITGGQLISGPTYDLRSLLEKKPSYTYIRDPIVIYEMSKDRGARTIYRWHTGRGIWIRVTR